MNIAPPLSRRSRTHQTSHWLIASACALLMAGCGSSGGDAPPASPSAASVAQLANICTPPGEKSWVRAHLDDVYLWYSQIPQLDPNAYATPADYFYALLVRPTDRFSFTISQAQADALFTRAQDVGYGAEFAFDASRQLRIAYVEPNSPASQGLLARGATITAINGTPVSALTSAQLNAALFPAAVGTPVTLTIVDLGSTVSRSATLTSATIQQTPVPQYSVSTTADGKKLGYLLFNAHLAPAEAPLIEAMRFFQTNGISDLVLDIRYNGGGFLYIASELASMIGGPRVQGRTFERLVYNDKHPEKTNSPSSMIPFYPTSSSGAPLPQLGLPRVFVLTGPGSCSASESVINGLSPFVQVIQIGRTTCGKPYGFHQTNNCAQAYFAIDFQGVNELQQGGYVNGFAPTCTVRDDFEHALGDPNEAVFRGAVNYRATGTCPPVVFSPLAADLSVGPELNRRAIKIAP